MAAKRRGILRASVAWSEVRDTPYGLTPIIIFVALALFSGLGAEFFTVAGPNIAQDLNLDLRTVGGIFAVVGVISLAATLFFGWLTDRVKRVWLSGIGVLFSGTFLVLQSLAQNVGFFTAMRVGQSVGSLPAQGANRALLADYYPVETRGRALSFDSVVGESTGLISLVLSGLLITAVGWRWTNALLSLPIVVIGIVFLAVMREPKRGYFEKKSLGFDEATAEREDEPLSFGEGWRTVWSVRMLRRFFIASIFAAVGGQTAKFVPFFLADRYGLDAFHRAMYAIPTAIALIVGGLLGGGFIDVLGKRSPSSVLRFLGLMSVLPILGNLAYALHPPIGILVTVDTLTNFGQGVFLISFIAVLSQIIPPKVRGQGLVVLSLSQIPGTIFLGLIFGTVAATYGFTSMWLLTIPFTAIAGVLLISLADFYEVDRRNAALSTAVDEEARRAHAEGRSKLLICRGINVFYDANQVLFGVDFEVEEGEIVALLGTNGAGKSTLLRAISGTQEASDGAIVLDGRDITHMPPHEITGRGVVTMPGGRGIFPGLTVEDNLKLATWLTPDETPELLEEAYARFPVLRERRDQLARLLSGGEQQMLGLAQAFMARPKLLMIDELSLGLSPAAVAELVKQVQEINRRGTTVIVVEQSVNVALSIAQRAVFMEKGEVRFVGPTSELLKRPDIVRAVYVRGAAADGRSTTKRRDEPTEETVILDVRGVTKRFGGVTALDGVDLSLRERQVLGIIGPNGSGKTTLFDVISGYQPADEGTIVFDGKDVTSLAAHERARLGLVRRFQDARLFPSLTVMESLLVAFDQRIDTSNLVFAAVGGRGSRRNERRARERAERLIALLDLGAYRDKFVKELSTGLRRIVDIAWVLATEPKVLLLDEPSSGIAQAETRLLAPLLRRVQRETDCSILIIEHDIRLVSEVADELVAMALGRVVTQGAPDDVLDDPRVAEAFLGATEPKKVRT